MGIASSLALIGAMLLLAASPGPGVFATISRALTSGFSHATVLVLGCVLGDIIFLLLAIYGLNVVALVLGEFFIIIKYIGGAYLLYLGYKIYTSRAHLQKIDEIEEISWTNNFLSGLFITLANPKVILFYIGFLPVFINLELLTTFDVIIVVIIVSITLAAVLLAYAYMAARAKDIFTSAKAVKNLNRISGSVMMGAGTFLIFKN